MLSLRKKMKYNLLCDSGNVAELLSGMMKQYIATKCVMTRVMTRTIISLSVHHSKNRCSETTSDNRFFNLSFNNEPRVRGDLLLSFRSLECFANMIWN